MRQRSVVATLSFTPVGGVKLRVATTDLCLISLLCFRSTSNGIERSSPSHHPINVVLLFGIYIYIYIYIFICHIVLRYYKLTVLIGDSRTDSAECRGG